VEDWRCCVFVVEARGSVVWCRGVAAVKGPAELCERCGCSGRSCERAAVVEERPELRRVA